MEIRKFTVGPQSANSVYTLCHYYASRCLSTCREISDISHTLVGNEIVDHSDVVGASPVGAAPTTSSFST